MFRYSLLSAIFGAITAFSGILLANYLSLPPGPMVVFSGIAIFAFTIVVNWKMKITT
jgi:ABC-type Mn2+/Zn2+ transport system permease subunit